MIAAAATAASQKHEVPGEGKGGKNGLSRLAEGVAILIGPDSRALIFAYAICVGAVFYFFWRSEPPVWLSGGALIVGIALWLLARAANPSNLVFMACVVLAGICTGHFAGTLRSLSVAAPTILSETRPVMVEGWLAEIEPGNKGVRLRIDVHAIAGLPEYETPAFVRLTHRSRLEVAPGRFVRCWAVLRPPPAPGLPGEYDFQRQAWFEKLGAVGYVQGRCRGGTLGAPASILDQKILQLAAIRRNLALVVADGAGERAGGFAAALVSGDRSLMNFEDQEALRRSGLAHLLAISGLHLAIVGGLVFLIVRRTLTLIEPLALRIAVQKPAAIVALTACAAYLILSGASVSTQRAFIMAAIVFGAVLFDRAAISLRTFAIALTIVVILQPESVLAPGFQMSFAATGALIAAYEAWRNHRSGRERVLGPIGFSWASIAMTSIVAGLATAPYSLFHFDRLAAFGFIANLVAMPIISFFTAPAAALAFVLSLFGAADIGLRLFGYSLEAVLAVGHYFAALDTSTGGSPQPMPGATLALFSAGLGFAIAARGPARVIFLAAFIIPAAWIWADAPKFAFHWSQSGTVYVADADGDLHAIALVKGEGLSPLRYSNLKPTECPNTPCSFDLGNAATLTLSPEIAGETEPLPARGAGLVATQDNSIMIFDWDNIRSQRPVTGYFSHDKLVIAPEKPCSDRPWRACTKMRSVVASNE